MVSPPWEPYPERKRKLDERSRRPKNTHKRRESKACTEGAADGLSTSSRASADTKKRPCGAQDSKDPVGLTDGTSHIWHESDEVHARARTEDCCCLLSNGCGDEDGCCAEDSRGVMVCPCLHRLPTMVIAQNKKAEIDTCGVCMEDGALRPCCNRHYCRSCYEGTGNCPGCHLITIGANRGVMNQSKLSSNFEEGGVAAAVIPEGEECRMCLRQGFARKCCGEFYCSECFFRSGYCPNCQVAAEKRIKYQRKPHNPGLVPVLIGYLATLIVSLAALACVAVGVASNSSHITTVFGQTCYGFFPTCLTGPMCVAYTGDTAIGLDAITGWEICDDATTVQKIYGSYCIYDEEVFIYSSEKWGFDFCADELLSSSNGVYVFEDNFELWEADNISSNTMASARWDHVTNGRISSICGLGAGEGTMMFSGANYREAETLDLIIRFGGKLVFLIKMGPFVLDSSTVACKPAYGGNVYVYYSLDSGGTWETLTILETFSLRNEKFTEVEVEIPSTWTSSTVRFKWKQENFENALEFWALDNVRILSYFAEGWHETTAFGTTVDKETTALREIRCCLNSEQCDLSKSDQESIDCTQYTSETSNERALLGAELFVVLTGLVSFARSAYRLGEGMVLHGWEHVVPAFLRKKRSKIFMADDPVPGAMNKTFLLDVDLRWRLRFLVMVGLPLSICWLYCAALLRNFFLVEELTLLPDTSAITFKLKETGRDHLTNDTIATCPTPTITWHRKVHISGVFLLATFLDAHAIFLLARDVVCVLPLWVPKVDVDLRPSVSALHVGHRRIDLSDIKDAEMFSKHFCVWLAAGYVAGVMPWCLVALITKYSYIPYDAARYATVTFGSTLLVRAWLGPDWVVKCAYSARWLVTMDMFRRDDIGNALTAGKTKHLVIHSAIFGTLLTMGLLQLFDTRSFILLSGVAVCVFTFYGLGLSVVQGLPLTPCVKLTTIKRGTFIRIHRRVLCPCERHLSHCGDMHSRDELLCVFVRDALTFTEMLRGDDTIE